MRKYTVTASSVILYQIEIEAKDSFTALDIAETLDGSEWQAIGEGDFEIHQAEGEEETK